LGLLGKETETSTGKRSGPCRSFVAETAAEETK
jgi:hypothetical protein